MICAMLRVHDAAAMRLRAAQKRARDAIRHQWRGYVDVTIFRHCATAISCAVTLCTRYISLLRHDAAITIAAHVTSVMLARYYVIF